MKRAILTCTVVLAIVFAPAALAAGNGPTKSVYDHTAAKVQHAVSAALVVKKQATKKPTHVTHATVASSTLPFTGLDLGFLAGRRARARRRWAPASAASPASHRSRTVQI